MTSLNVPELQASVTPAAENQFSVILLEPFWLASKKTPEGVWGPALGKIFNLRWRKPQFFKDWSQNFTQKIVRSVQLASKSTNLRPWTQKTFGRKNTDFTAPGCTSKHKLEFRPVPDKHVQKINQPNPYSILVRINLMRRWTLILVVIISAFLLFQVWPVPPCQSRLAKGRLLGLTTHMIRLSCSRV